MAAWFNPWLNPSISSSSSVQRAVDPIEFNGDDFLDPQDVNIQVSGESTSVNPVGEAFIVPDLQNNPQAGDIADFVNDVTVSIPTITGDTTIDLNGTPGFPFGDNPSALNILLGTEFFAQKYAPYYSGSFDFGFDPVDPFGGTASFLGYPHYSGFGNSLLGASPLLVGIPGFPTTVGDNSFSPTVDIEDNDLTLRLIQNMNLNLFMPILGQPPGLHQRPWGGGPMMMGGAGGLMGGLGGYGGYSMSPMYQPVSSLPLQPNLMNFGRPWSPLLTSGYGMMNPMASYPSVMGGMSGMTMSPGMIGMTGGLNLGIGNMGGVPSYPSPMSYLDSIAYRA